jgi:multisubunit Na+/H+ antiporter MnhC subunit
MRPDPYFVTFVMVAAVGLLFVSGAYVATARRAIDWVTGLLTLVTGASTLALGLMPAK